MRSSKSRSRSKSNRNNNRSMGNIVNRVFESSGPEGKVRGTPQQIIDKYNQLARDAQLGNDRVATENFQQHAEHYLRMLSEALREQAEKQGQNQQGQGGQNRDDYDNNQSDGGNHNRQNDNRGNDNRSNDNRQNDNRQNDNRDRNDNRGNDNRGGESNRQNDNRGERNNNRGDRNERQPERAASQNDQQPSTQPDVIDLGTDTEESSLVETPESRPRPKRTRRKAVPEASADTQGDAQPDTSAAEAEKARQDAAE